MLEARRDESRRDEVRFLSVVRWKHSCQWCFVLGFLSFLSHRRCADVVKAASSWVGIMVFVGFRVQGIWPRRLR